MVSTIIITHNRLDLLKKAITSVLSQTYKDIECIVVDNNSTDGTRDYCEKLDGIRYIHHIPTIGNGCNQARNMAIRLARGEWCAFLDDDDSWFPTKIEEQLAVAKRKDCNIVYCGIRKEDIDLEGRHSFMYCPPNPNLQGDMRRKCLFSHIALTSTLLIKKSVLLENNLFDEHCQFWQERELLMRLLQHNSIYAAEKELILYRADKTDAARQTNKLRAWERSIRYIYQKHAGLVQRLSPYERGLVKKDLVGDALSRTNPKSLYHRLLLCQRKLLKVYLVTLQPLERISNELSHLELRLRPA